MPNLYPDMRRDSYEGSDGFIYAAPLNGDDFRRLMALSLKAQNGVHFYSDAVNKVTILLREAHHTDEDVVEAGAWLRMLLGDKNRMYAAPWIESTSFSDTVAATVGAPRELCVMYDLPRTSRNQVGDDDDES